MAGKVTDSESGDPASRSQKERAQVLSERQGEQLRRDREGLEELMRAISHDLAEPLRGICGFARLLEVEQRERLDEGGRQCLGFLLRGVEQIEHCWAGWVRISRVVTRAGPLGRVDARQALDEAWSELAALVRETRAEVRVGPLPIVHASRHQMVELFREILSNALTYRSDAAPRIRIHAETTSGRGRFELSDNGAGMDPHDLRPLVRLSRVGEFEGGPLRGFGLAVSHRIVERAGGRLHLESERGKGTTVHFDLPLYPDP